MLPLYCVNTPNAHPGRVLCFIHTWGTDGADFDLLAETLPHETLPCHIVFVDLPGHWQSPETSYPSVTAIAIRVLQTLESGAEEVILIGHGEGCRIALEAWHQTVNSSTWNLNIVGIGFLDGLSYKLRAQPQGALPVVGQTAAANLEALEDQVAHMFSVPNDFAEYTNERLVTRILLDTNFDHWLKDEFKWFDYNPLDGLLSDIGRSGIPFLNLQSTSFDENDDYTVDLERTGPPTPWMWHLRARIPQARQYIISHSGHWMQVDRPQRVANKIMQHLVNRIW